MSKVAIVILNWNGKKHLATYLPSVVEHSQGARIIVADNASSDDSISFLQENYPHIELIQNTENGGFAKGYNDALKRIDSEFYLLLNSDIEVSPNWLDPLLEQMSDPEVAGCQPKVLALHNRSLFEHAGAAGGFLDRNYFPFCRGRIVDAIEEDQSQYDTTSEVFWATGAAMLIRSEVYHKVGGFDEIFFAHMEEIDMCWRIKRLGYRFVCAPASVVYHLGGGTLNYMSPRKTYLNFRNSLFMLIKNHPGWLFPKLFYRLCLDGIAAARFLVKGEFTFFAAVFNAHMAMYTKMVYLLGERKRLKSVSHNGNLNGLYRGSIIWARYFKGISKFSDLNQRLFEKY